MDIVTLGMVRQMPGTAVSEAQAAAERAEAAAAQIEGLNYEISVSGTKLIINERSD